VDDNDIEAAANHESKISGFNFAANVSQIRIVESVNMFNAIVLLSLHIFYLVSFASFTSSLSVELNTWSSMSLADP